MKIALSVIGTGYIAQRFLKLLPKYPDVSLDYVLTRRPIDEVWVTIPKVTRDPSALIGSDIIVDFSNDAKYLYNLIKDYYSTKKIVTFNSEFHVTYPNITKEYPSLRITEGEGDQPGSFAVLERKIRQLNLEPLMFINHKRYLDYNPSPDSMKEWAKKYGLSEKITVASTDGTKVSFETAFVANAFGLTVPIADSKQSYYYHEYDLYPPIDKLAFIVLSNTKGINIAAQVTKKTPIKDIQYLGVSLNDKTWTEFSIPFHLCQYDIINTIRDLYYRNDILLNGSFGRYRYNVYAISKTWLNPGDTITTGIGGYDVRGELKDINDFTDRQPLPIIDCENVRVKVEITPGMLIYKDMVEPI